MIDYQQSIDYQSDQFKEKIAVPLLESLQSLPTKKVEKTYKYIFLLNHLKSRPELKKFWNEYLNWSISFLYESFVSASLGQKHGCYFLLRSSLENFVKFICVAIGKKEEIDNRVFKKNNHILVTYNWPKDNFKLQSKASSFQTMYNEFSKLSHSATKLNNQSPITYFQKIVEGFDKEYNDAMESIQSLSVCYMYFIIFICKKSLKKWDTKDLTSILKISCTKHEAEVILNLIKK